ncbi:MAG: M15 family metallopeptidase [Treponema sp.]|nr:M15 family metallopeptidase [Treponema sp.]
MKKSRIRIFARFSILIFLLAFFCLPAFALELRQREHNLPPAELVMFRNCYPDLKFTTEYVAEKDDWKLEVEKSERPGSAKKKKMTFFWADARMIPEANLSEKENYLPILYAYDKKLKKPDELTKEEIEFLKEYGTKENQKKSIGSSMFFFDFLYDAYSEKIIERHIVKMKFLGCSTKIHERIVQPIKNVEKKIYAEKGNKEVKSFLDSLTSTDAYFWRVIANTNRKSFHSYGIAVDCLPKRLYGKQTYWSWAKNIYGDNWMLIPFSERWMPPKRVVQIFESEGFIWGGKWGIWDTMHFEYHPELIKYNDIGK